MICWKQFKLPPSRINHLKIYFDKPEDMCEWSKKDFMNLSQISHISIKEIENVLSLYGLKLKEEPKKKIYRRIRREI